MRHSTEDRWPLLYVRRSIREINDWRRRRRILKAWIRGHRPIPPPHEIKEMIVREYARAHGMRTMIETGTYMGQMIDATIHQFERIVSIELGEELYRKANQRFGHCKHIMLLHGDSADTLGRLLQNISESCLFWLDAHYSEGITVKGSKNTPVKEELRKILTHSVEGHVILIDDARCFTGRDDYPTIDELRTEVRTYRPDWVCEVRHDIVRIHGRGGRSTRL